MPDTQITWVIGKGEASLFRGLDGVELIEYDKKKRTGTLRQHLASRHFDALLLMQVALRAGFVSRFVSAPLRLGFDASRSRDGHRMFINRRIAAEKPGHVVDGFFGFSEFFGITDRVLRWDIPVPETAIVELERLLSLSQPFLVISPCSSQRAHNFRNWSPENYAAVAAHAYRECGLQVVITGTGTAEERAYSRRIQQVLTPVPIIDLVGKTDLKMLFALLARAIAVIAPDSGPVHMSVAAGTPAIGLYATSNPARTGPVLGQRWIVNQYPAAVRRFLGKDVGNVRWGRRVRHPDAMSLIQPAMVIEQLDRLLATPVSERLGRMPAASQDASCD